MYVKLVEMLVLFVVFVTKKSIDLVTKSLLTKFWQWVLKNDRLNKFLASAKLQVRITYLKLLTKTILVKKQKDPIKNFLDSLEHSETANDISIEELEVATTAYQEYLEGRDKGKSLEEVKAELDC